MQRVQTAPQGFTLVLAGVVGRHWVEDEETSSALTHPLTWDQVIYPFLVFPPCEKQRKTSNST